jgi:hypothetical protein
MIGIAWGRNIRRSPPHKKLASQLRQKHFIAIFRNRLIISQHDILNQQLTTGGSHRQSNSGSLLYGK